MTKPAILFLSRGRRDPMFIDTINILKDKYHVVVITNQINHEIYSKIDNISIESSLSIEELKAACKNVTPSQLESIKKIEKELEINCYEFNVNYLLYRKFVSRYGAAHVHAFPNEHIPQRLYLDYNFISEIINKYSIKYAFYETLDLIDSMIINAMAQQGMIKKAFEHSVESLGGELRLRIATGQYRRSPRIEHTLTSCELSKESLLWAEKTVAQYKHEKPKTKYDDYHTNLGKIINRVPVAKICNKIKRVFNGESFLPATIKLKNRILSAKYFSKNLPDTKIVSYFLQLTPEASMCSQVPEFADQEYLIEQIAIHGKYGYTVAVKEHPACYGNRGPRFYKELNLLPNVVLLPPSFPTRNLITRSEAVIVATGTSPGLESIATGVPVICLGKPYFNICGNTVKANSPREVWDALEKIKSKEAEQINFIAAMHQATYKHPQFETPEEFELGKGIGKIMAKALDDEIELYESGALK
ncbi:Capsule polysaccharide biosynthesis protein [Maridesulfovibrio ferrireducens]|uniref:Capsule polysaccharide biosynthesis protein n=1 Tax=Maridesulfovibrio ferrireducens TaxID=246191 RepID=A0A1G9CNZ6_9BACT|nr:hypothetical protein [Maridesulfovibrio ferrireducens]SDK53411.1 Capsule polysaccharide biosynthesis protein [Maridesulfovibrio ferrireducens]